MHTSGYSTKLSVLRPLNPSNWEGEGLTDQYENLLLSLLKQMPHPDEKEVLKFSKEKEEG